MRDRRRWYVVSALCVVVLGVGVAACGSDDDDGGADGGASTAQAGTAIEIVDFAFAPEELRADVGDTITVTNRDDTEHTVTADDGAFDTGDIAGMGTATFELAGPGTFTYHCDIHNYMTGTITVSE